MKHLFVICAYKESPYLGDCIASLENQAEKSDIILCTATPSPYLEKITAEHGIPYVVHENAKPDIAGDWNFALETCKKMGADYATIAHQDDLYLPEYGKRFRQAAEKHDDILIYFTDYGEQRGEEAVTVTRNLKIKRLLLWRMKLPALQTSRHARHRTLALGDPISCPTVTYNLNRLPLPLFESGMTTNLDWQTWEKLSRLEGRFCFDGEVGMLHRIHAESTTSKVIASTGRTEQDYAMYRKFWPAPVARLLTRMYAGSEKSNNV